MLRVWPLPAAFMPPDPSYLSILAPNYCSHAYANVPFSHLYTQTPPFLYFLSSHVVSLSCHMTLMLFFLCSLHFLLSVDTFLWLDYLNGTYIFSLLVSSLHFPCIHLQICLHDKVPFFLFPSMVTRMKMVSALKWSNKASLLHIMVSFNKSIGSITNHVYPNLAIKSWWCDVLHSDCVNVSFHCANGLDPMP